MRRLDEASFAAIVRDAWRGSTPVAVADGAPLDTADGRFRQLVSDIAVELALAEARRRWPASTPDPLPVWRPGPGIRVARGVEAHAWIGIKGTPAPTPRFFVSEGERAFAEAHPEHYRLWVYVDIDAERRSGSLVEHRGPLAGPAVALTPSRWAGSLRT